MPRYRTTHAPRPARRRNLSPLWFSLAGLALLLIAGLALRNGGLQSKRNLEVQGAARLKVDQETIDHGDVGLGTMIRDVVRVTNAGDQTLRFTRAPYIEVLEGC